MSTLTCRGLFASEDTDGHRPPYQPPLLHFVFWSGCFGALCFPALGPWWVPCVWTAGFGPSGYGDIALLVSWPNQAPDWTPFTYINTNTHVHSPPCLLNTLVALLLVEYYQFSASPRATSGVFYWPRELWSFLSLVLTIRVVGPEGFSPHCSRFDSVLPLCW